MHTVTKFWQELLERFSDRPGTLWIYLYPVILIALAVAVAMLYPGFGQRWFYRSEKLLSKLAARWQAYLFIGIFALLLNAGLSYVRFPQPGVHDEFSYLLASDTFAHGRLTNPTHPLWQHFETFYVNHQPTYASKYPPAQGLVMALGTLIGGHPLVGVWLSVILAGMAIFWSLKSFFPAKWAMIGSLLAMTHPYILGWGQNYWGGAVALTGGALVIGAAYRAIIDTSAKNAFWLGGGMLILSLSRPFEGLLFCFAVLLTFALLILPGKGINRKNLWRRFLPALLLVMLFNLGFLLYYNWRVTGHPLLLPYTINHETYWRTPLFVWQSFGEKPVYKNQVMEHFYASMAEESIRYQTLTGIASSCIRRVTSILRFIFFSPALLAATLLLPLLLRASRLVRAMAATWIIFFGGTLLSVWFFLHYYAPALIVFFIIGIAGLRYLKCWKYRKTKLGLALVRWLTIFTLLCVIRQAVLLKTYYGDRWAYRRAEIAQKLQDTNENHLVLVKYSSDYFLQENWTYNEADIDAARIVWTYDMGEDKNKEILTYYKARKLWLLEVSPTGASLKPYASN